MTDLAVLFIGNKHFILCKELLKTRFPDSFHNIKHVINKNHVFRFFCFFRC